MDVEETIVMSELSDDENDDLDGNLGDEEIQIKTEIKSELSLHEKADLSPVITNKEYNAHNKSHVSSINETYEVEISASDAEEVEEVETAEVIEEMDAIDDIETTDCKPVTIITTADSTSKILPTTTKPSEKKRMKDEMDDVADIVDIKRKRYELRRSGSREYLLGFDEDTGEAQLTNDYLMEEEKAEEENHLHLNETAKIIDEKKMKKKMVNNDDLLTTKSPAISAKLSNDIKKVKIELKSSSTAPATNTREAEIKEKKPTSTTKSSESVDTTAALKAKNNKSKTATSSDTTTATKTVEARSTLKGGHIVGDVEILNHTTAKSNVGSSKSNTARSGGNLNSAKKGISPQDEYYRKPFEYGWRRELVWRANLESSKDKADVYFISPSGKKLRSRGDIAMYLEGDLTIDHFCFAREPLGVGPELETVRSAKPSSRVSVTAATLAAAPTPPNMGKRISKPKGPKGASPPPQGWTPTKALKVNNAALLSSSQSNRQSSSHHSHHSNSATPTSGRRHDSHRLTSVGDVSSSSQNTSGPAGASGHSNKTSKMKKSLVGTGKVHEDSSNHKVRSSSNRDSESLCHHSNCLLKSQQKQRPSLQCSKCLHLYHSECVGLSSNHDYRTIKHSSGRDFVCKSCLPKENVGKTLTTATNSPSSSSSAAAATAAATAAAATPSTTTSSSSPLSSLLTITTTPTSSLLASLEKKLPQSIAVVKGKKYVVISKPLPPTINEHVNDIDNDLRQINDSMQKKRKHSMMSNDGSQHYQSVGTATTNMPYATHDQSQKIFAQNFFANVSFAFDALLSVLKYLKIHERSRAASVCKLWNLAAKDTSLWQTVRMKNSKVCSWSGFAAALRRGETKHLDLRKMLLSSTRGEEMWNDFCEHIGTVCSLETLDLCRCSSRVVESLFHSNRKLRILNALAINDDTINLENAGLLTQLRELRLRTCEAGVLAGDIQSLASLSQLQHMSLTSIKGLGEKSIEILGQLTALKSLELGECGDFDSTFAEAVLPKLINLQRLRLENGQITNCCTLEILDSVARLERLQQLELVNFDIKPGFDEKLGLCTSLTKLLIIPTYISQSATTNHIVLSAVQHMTDTMKCFTWGVTVELLRVTALYVDQCEESTKKEKHHFDECIPVLKPVPGASSIEDPDDNDEETAEVEENKNAKDNSKEDQNNDSSEGVNNEVPQIEILPLDKVESILAQSLPHTKYTIVKVPYHATCKQQLVE